MSFYNSVNLHPSFFQKNLPVQPKRRTRESVETERALPVNLQKEEKKGFFCEVNQKENRQAKVSPW